MTCHAAMAGAERTNVWGTEVAAICQAAISGEGRLRIWGTVVAAAAEAAAMGAGRWDHLVGDGGLWRLVDEGGHGIPGRENGGGTD
jgi:hypothetical protein